jgi:site-specific recombinase XerD
MTQSTQAISPLRQRMIEDMQLRKLAPKTQTSYIRAVRKLADYLGHSPDRASAEDLRRFQLYLTDQGTSRITINATITALRFFFEVTVGDKSIADKLNTVPVPRKLPVVLSREEVSRLLEATSSLKYKAAFALAYGAGLRISATVSARPCTWSKAKGARIVTRCCPRHYWIFCAAGGAKAAPGDYYSMAAGCFPGRTRSIR